MAGREDTLLEAMRGYMARFRKADVNFIDALDTRKSGSQVAREMAMQPWRTPETHRPSALLSHLRGMGYRGDADTVEQDLRLLERDGKVRKTGSRSWRPADDGETTR